jgi:hypothetical protein
MNRERIEETVRLWQAEPDKAKGKPTVIARVEGSKAVMEHGARVPNLNTMLREFGW